MTYERIQFCVVFKTILTLTHSTSLWYAFPGLSPIPQVSTTHFQGSHSYHKSLVCIPRAITHSTSLYYTFPALPLIPQFSSTHFQGSHSHHRSLIDISRLLTQSTSFWYTFPGLLPGAIISHLLNMFCIDSISISLLDQSIFFLLVYIYHILVASHH